MYRLDIDCSYRAFLLQQRKEPGGSHHAFAPGVEEPFPQIGRLRYLARGPMTAWCLTYGIFCIQTEGRNDFRDREIDQNLVSKWFELSIRLQIARMIEGLALGALACPATASLAIEKKKHELRNQTKVNEVS
jgi:hypothetical protein